MKTTIAYVLTLLGLPVAVITVITFILAIPFYLILEKLFGSKIKKWLILDFIREAMAGIFMIWFTIILWTWLKVTPSILIPVLLVIPIITWNWIRIKPQIGTKTQWDEVASGLGELAGVITGFILLL